MSIFRKHTTLPVPEPYSADDIMLGRSACTGERTIGFYDKNAKRLMHEELVLSGKDISGFYKKYGLTPPNEEPKEII
ncbi:MAG: hypothetical protein GXY08_02745 [Ruminococcus sp.]|mgnify:CR=1 FL=1|nr:hypothetical protein [Ruminococcus sp.]